MPEICLNLCAEVFGAGGTRQILILASDAALNDDDPDLIVFIGIASETDEVPSDGMLKFWNSEAIAKYTPNWSHLENWAEGYGAVACRNFLARF
nr:hypothetical protein [Roseobacter litoralis]